MIIALVVAVSRNGIIGHNGKLPWNLPSDLARFKQLTMGKPIIMGRKTWDSLPRQPLPGRLNIVLTRQPGFVAVGAAVAATPHLALQAAQVAQAGEVCIIGGADVYALFLPQAHRIYRTMVDADVHGDTRFPPFEENQWQVVSSEAIKAGPKDTSDFEVQVLHRR